MPSRFEISYKTIFFIISLLLFLWFLVQIREIIFLVFIAFILMSAFKPWVEELEKISFPRPLAAFIIYALIFGVFAYLGGTLLPLFVTQSVKLLQTLPSYIHSVLPFLTIDAELLSTQLTPLGENVFKVTLEVFSNILFLFSLFVVSFYLLVERKELEPHLASFMGNEGAKRIIRIVRQVEMRLGAWVRGQLTLMMLVWLGTFIGLSLLGIPFALPLSILAGILEIVPIIGPIISAVPTVLVALTISPFLALLTALLYLLIQQAENNFIVPLVMKKAVGLPPLVTIIALMVGGKVAGFLGAMLAVPIVVTIETVISAYVHLQEVKTPKIGGGS